MVDHATPVTAQVHAGVLVTVPMDLQRLTRGNRYVRVKGATVAEVLQGMDVLFPGFSGRIVKPSGEFADHYKVYVGGINIKQLQGTETIIPPRHHLDILAY